jgi:diaminopimelate decarboxylase/aspartate kinase
MGAPETEAAGPPAWWRERRGALLDVAAAGTPVYAYDADTLRARARALRGLRSVEQVLFAVKANPFPPLLQLLAEEGLGFECVSPGEVGRARGILEASGSAAPVLFTPNFAPRGDYAFGFETGARVTLDNLHPLEHWGDLLAGQSVFLRVDPGKGHGHHAHVRTAGERSKFGVPPAELERAAQLAARHGVRVVGLHAHVGSGVRDPSAWPATAERLVRAAEAWFPDARVLDLGGGLGVPEKPGQAPLDLDALDAALADFHARHPGYRVWLEPGRFVVAESGALLARVTQLKEKGRSTYVGVDAGMHTLIRPALYGAYHGIVNLSRLDQAGPWIDAEVVGPICETGDVLGHDRRLVAPTEGDVLLVATAGAYGAAMASEYNLRGRPREVLLDRRP